MFVWCSSLHPSMTQKQPPKKKTKPANYFVHVKHVHWSSVATLQHFPQYIVPLKLPVIFGSLHPTNPIRFYKLPPSSSIKIRQWWQCYASLGHVYLFPPVNWYQIASNPTHLLFIITRLHHICLYNFFHPAKTIPYPQMYIVFFHTSPGLLVPLGWSCDFRRPLFFHCGMSCHSVWAGLWTPEKHEWPASMRQRQNWGPQSSF